MAEKSSEIIVNKKNLERYIKTGLHDKNWYADHQSLLTKLFGAERLKLVTSVLAATSINSSLPSNIRLFRRAMHEIEKGLPFGRYLPVMRKQLELIRAGDEISGRKIRSFAAALSGDTNAVVVDIWLLRAFDQDRKYTRTKKVVHPLGHTIYMEGLERSGGATERQYTFIESYVRTLAQEMEMEARELSAIIWSGVRITMSGNRQTKYKEVLEHQLFNMFRQ